MTDPAPFRRGGGGSAIFGNANPVLFQESRPWMEPKSSNQPVTKNKYTQFHQVRAPFNQSSTSTPPLLNAAPVDNTRNPRMKSILTDTTSNTNTDFQVYQHAPPPKTRFGRTQTHETKHLTQPDPQSPQFQSTFQRGEVNFAPQERTKRQQVDQARLEKRRQYSEQIDQRKYQKEERAHAEWENRRITKQRERERYENVFDSINTRNKMRGYGKKAFDKNMTAEEFSELQKTLRER